MTAEKARAVRFDRYGGREVLYVTDIDRPVPGAGEVLVEVRAAGINPGEAGIRSGALHAQFPATFPSGEGSAEASTPAVLTEIANLVASGDVDFDIAATYPLDRVADAFEELEQRHTHGKIVLLPQVS